MRADSVNTHITPAAPGPYASASKRTADPHRSAGHTPVSEAASVSVASSAPAAGLDAHTRASGENEAPTRRPPVWNDCNAQTEAVYAFVDAYNALTDELERLRQLEASPDGRRHTAANNLRTTLYRSVDLGEQDRKISLYELGISHSSDYREAGRLTVRKKKLRTALENRRRDAALLFNGGADSWLAALCTLAKTLVSENENSELERLCENFISKCEDAADVFSIPG